MEVVVRRLTVAKALWPLEVTMVQLVVFCTIIEAQVVFEILLVLITSQLAIAGQLEEEVCTWKV